MQPFQQRLVVSLAACASIIVLFDQSGTAARSTAVLAQAAAAKQSAPKPAGASDLKPYSETIPDTKVTFDMVPIPGGNFTMGSPAAEPGRAADEGPQVKVTVSPFYMSAHEVTWDEYDLFAFRKRTPLQPGQTPAPADAVTKPTPPYADETWGFGKGKQPAIGMTWHAAAEYCRWLSAKTGKLYRLPTEAEWEYAARAGTTTAYFFGNDPKDLTKYAWYGKNSDFKYQKVGKKLPNPWGLCDIYGNVVEWCLDQYDPNYYKQFATELADNSWNRATKLYPLTEFHPRKEENLERGYLQGRYNAIPFLGELVAPFAGSAEK